MSQDAKYYRLAMRIFVDFSGAIAIPAVAAALLGKWLDTRYGTEPRYVILLLIVSFALSGYIVVKKAKQYRDSYEVLNNSKETSREI